MVLLLGSREHGLCSVPVLSLLLNDPTRMLLSLAAEEHYKLQRKVVRLAKKYRLKTHPAHCPVCACGQMPTMWTRGISIG